MALPRLRLFSFRGIPIRLDASWFAIAVLVTAFITFDGESNWGEGVSLLALYAIIATSFWWG